LTRCASGSDFTGSLTKAAWAAGTGDICLERKIRNIPNIYFLQVQHNPFYSLRGPQSDLSTLTMSNQHWQLDVAEPRNVVQSDDEENVPQSLQGHSHTRATSVKQGQQDHIQTHVRSPDRPAGMSKEEKARIDAMLAQDDFTRTSAFSKDNPAALSRILRVMDDELIHMKEQIGNLENLNEGRLLYMHQSSAEYKEAQKTFMKVKMAHLDLVLAVLKMRESVKPSAVTAQRNAGDIGMGDLFKAMETDP
jgi:hypothetical protein